MNFITKTLLTILILLPVVGAVLTLAHQAFWKQEEPAQMGHARLHAGELS